MWQHPTASTSVKQRSWVRAALLALTVGFGAAQAAEPTADAGRAIYQAQHCMRCHALEGKGNRLRPLDDVGQRLDAAAIRDRVTGGPGIKDRLDKRAMTAKQKFAALPATDLDALVAFLAAQQAPAPSKPK